MDNKKQTTKVLSTSNYPSLDTLSSFVRTYIEKLVYNVLTYVDSDITVGTINVINSYDAKFELSQDITGVPSAFSIVDGTETALASFAEQYSHLGINSFDLLAREAILDFLNLHNGLFVVELSKNNICELSLNAPKQNGHFALDKASYKSIIVIPIVFTYGEVRFLLCEA